MNKQNQFLSLAGLLLLLICAGCGADGRTGSSGTETAEKYALPIYFRHDAEAEPDLAFVSAFAEEIRKTYNEAYEGYWKLEDLEIKITNIDTDSDTYYVRAYGDSESVCGHAEHPFMKGMYQALEVFETEEEKAWAKEKIVGWMEEIEGREMLPDERISKPFENSYKVVGSLEQGFEIFYMKKKECFPLGEEFSREDYEAGYERGYHELLRLTAYFHPTWDAPLPDGFTYTAKYNGDLHRYNGKYSGALFYQGELCGSVTWRHHGQENWIQYAALLAHNYSDEVFTCKFLGTRVADSVTCHVIEGRTSRFDESVQKELERLGYQLTEEEANREVYIVVYGRNDDVYGWDFTIYKDLCDEEGLEKMLSF